MDKSGIAIFFSVFALKIPDGMDNNASLVEADKYGIYMRDANALLDNSSEEINVKVLKEHYVTLSPMQNGKLLLTDVFVTQAFLLLA